MARGGAPAAWVRTWSLDSLAATAAPALGLRGGGLVWSLRRWLRRSAWPTERAGYGETRTERGGTVGRKPAVSAWGLSWLVAAGTWTPTRVPTGVRACAGNVRPWGSGAWRVWDAEERHVHVPCPAVAARRERRVPSDVPGRGAGFRARGAGGYAPLVAVQRGSADSPGCGPTCPARGACPGRA